VEGPTVKLTARADYAVRAALELATADPGTLVKADRVAEAQDIPRHFLDNVLTDLRRAGLVVTQRGPDGGSRLARPADEITLAQVVRAIEGPLAAVRDVRPEALTYTGPAQRLPEVWIAVRAALRGVLERVTIADVASGHLPAEVELLAAEPDAWTPH
jgi:Rrf2 family protein